MPTFALINKDSGIVENTIVADSAEIAQAIYPENSAVEVTATTGNPVVSQPYIEGIFVCRPKPFNSWVLNKDAFDWQPPFDMPADGKLYEWDEPSVSWVEVDPPEITEIPTPPAE